jgi:hypothetical protein
MASDNSPEAEKVRAELAELGMSAAPPTTQEWAHQTMERIQAPVDPTAYGRDLELVRQELARRTAAA